MASVDALTRALIGFVQTDGYLALFVFIVLETAWITHFTLSEVTVPFAAAYLVSTPGGLRSDECPKVHPLFVRGPSTTPP